MSNSNSSYLNELVYNNRLVVDKWRTVKEKIHAIGPSSESDTLNDYKVTFQLIQKLNNHEEEDHKLLAEPATRAFFLNDFFPNVARYLLMNRSYVLLECTILHESILMECLKFFNKMLLREDIPRLSEMFRFALDSSKGYYKTTNQDDDLLSPVNIKCLRSLF